jgi:hypothetical protein
METQTVAIWERPHRWLEKKNSIHLGAPMG